MRMLAKRPDDRFASLAEALTALGATPVGADDPLTAELQRLAAVSERLGLLADVIRTPASPVPQTRERPRAASPTPAGVPATQSLIVAVAPPPADLVPGSAAQLRAAVRNGAGQPVTETELVWSSSNPAVVSVDARTGALTATGAGVATITARAGFAEDSVEVTIAPLRPATAAHDADAAKHARTAPPRAENAAVSRSPAARTEPATAASSKSGIWRWLVPAVGVAGVAGYLVMQSATSKRATTAAPAPANQAQPTAPDSVTVAAGDSAAPAADSGAGVPTAAVSPGDSVGRAAPSATIASRIEIHPSRPDAITPGETMALEAIVRDADGGTMDNTAVTWATSNSRVATIDATRGIVRGLRAGSARITATLGSLTSAVTVSVAATTAGPGVVTSIDIADFRAPSVGESIRLSASVRTAAGPIANALVDWSSSNPSIAAIAQDGTLIARAPGTTTVHASSGGRSADRAVTIRVREIAAAPVSPPAASGRSEADLRSEIEVLLAAYARAIETRDTSLIRRIFPNAGQELMARWQTTFDDARANLSMSAGTIELLDTPRDVTGSQVRARASYSARFASRAARKDQSFPVTFVATLQRDGGTWRITAIR